VREHALLSLSEYDPDFAWTSATLAKCVFTLDHDAEKDRAERAATALPDIHSPEGPSGKPPTVPLMAATAIGT